MSNTKAMVRLGFGLMAAFTASGCACRSGSWATALDYSLQSGKASGLYAVLKDSKGRMFTGGFGIDSSNFYHWVIRRSLDGGTTWTTVDDQVAGTASVVTRVQTLVEGRNGVLLAAGMFRSSGESISRIIVRRSLDFGATWSTVYNELPPGASTMPTGGLSVDQQGQFWLTLTVGNASAQLGIRVMKSADGVTWSTAMEILGSSTATYRGEGLVQGLNRDTYFVTGSTVVASNTHWLTWKSTDAGATWSLVDDYVYNVGNSSYGVAIALGSGGRVLVGGVATTSLVDAALIRYIDPTGSAWANLGSTYVYNSVNPFTQGVALRMLPTGGGAFAVTAPDAASVTHWVVRVTADNGNTWTNSDDYTLVSTKSATPTGLELAPNGDVWASGYAIDASDVQHGIVRKWACQ